MHSHMILPSTKRRPIQMTFARSGRKVRTSRPAVLVFTDVFGWRSGRTRQICDQIAAQVGAQVVLPNFFYQDWDWGS